MSKRSRLQREEETDSEDPAYMSTEDNSIEGQKPIACKVPNSSCSMPGRIKSITLNNFMCHEHQKINLGPDTNFIIGSNGSGKSAILTAIIICLGAKVSFTQRASNLKAFIKEGQSACQITLELENVGVDAYKPEEYGDSIIIERRISKDTSGNSFKLKSSMGKTISTKKEDLTAICEYLKIQPDNPIVILSQENAKQFIGNTSACDKYKMFLKATHLSQLSEDLKIISEVATSTQQLVEGKIQIIPQLKEALKEAEIKYQSFEKAQNLHENIKQLKDHMAWAQVVEIEQLDKQLSDKKENYQERIALLKQKLETENNEHDNAKKELDQIIEEIRLHNEGENKLRDKLYLAKQNAEACKARVDDAKSTIIDIDKATKRCKQEIDNTQKKIDVEIAKLNQGDSRKKEIENHIEKTDEEVKGLEKDNLVNNNVLKEKENEYETSIKQVGPLENKIKESEHKQRSLREQLIRFQQQKSNSLSVFGQKVPDVLKDIENEKDWINKPIGPLGKFIKIKYPKWSKVIESIIGPTLDAFVVTNHRDQKLLANIMRKRDCYNRILVSKLDNFDYSTGEPDSRFLTILKGLEFQNEDIKRQLIVNNKIEKIILIEKRDEANNVMYKPPRNVLACYTVDGFQIGQKSGGYATMALNMHNGPSRLVQDKGDMINNIQKQLESVNDEINNLRQQVNKTEDYSRQLDVVIRDVKQGIYKRNNRIKQLLNRKKDLEKDLEEEEPANISVLEDTKKELESNLQLLKNQFKSAAESAKLVDAEFKQHKDKIEECKNEMIEFKKGLNAINEKREDKMQSISYYEQKIEHHNGRIKELENKLENVQKDIDSVQTTLKERMEKAIAYCTNRVQVNKSPEVLDREIKKLEIQLHKAEQLLNSTLEECFNDLDKKRTAYKKARVETHAMHNFITELQNSLEERKIRWEFFKKTISKRIKSLFQYQLSHRGFTGKLEIDHENQKLIPHVQINKGSKTSNSKNDPKTLSGGEKSFSTICLLLSFWEALECPIRCLDEFDVFMDGANRKLSAEMIINSARNSHGVQYLLITPQSISDVSLGKDITIIRLKDPQRQSTDQSRIEFGN